MVESSDLTVEINSHSLSGKKLDLIICGSIAATETVKLVRALRRLGATVFPYMTKGAADFVTPMALSWAAGGKEVVTSFTGQAKHISENDGCIVAPASANFIAKISQGILDDPASALVHSYLGRDKPVMVLPNMHSSLWLSPAVQNNVNTAKQWTTFLEPRREEDKLKFPDPANLASEISHKLNRLGKGYVFVSMGTTRGYIDDVRYISNYSTGALGTLIAHELYRYGHDVHVVCGPCEQKPSFYSKITHVQTYEEFVQACAKEVAEECMGAVFAASVLDFVPAAKRSGKIRSNEELKVDFKPTEKVIAKLASRCQGPRVGFKLESAISESEAQAVAKQYASQYGLDMMVVNPLPSTPDAHTSYIFGKLGSTDLGLLKKGTTKQDIADSIVQLFQK